MEQAKTAIDSCGCVYHFYKKRRLFYEKNLEKLEGKVCSKGEMNSQRNKAEELISEFR